MYCGWLNHLGLVDRIARRYALRFYRLASFDELWGAGLSGLWRAALGYDAAKDMGRDGFEGWAALFVRSDIVDWIRAAIDAFEEPKRADERGRRGERHRRSGRLATVTVEVGDGGQAAVDGRDFLDAMLPRLPERQREVVGRRLAGQDNRRAAREMGMTPGAEGSMFHAAKARLRELAGAAE